MINPVVAWIGRIIGFIFGIFTTGLLLKYADVIKNFATNFAGHGIGGFLLAGFIGILISYVLVFGTIMLLLFLLFRG